MPTVFVDADTREFRQAVTSMAKEMLVSGALVIRGEGEVRKRLLSVADTLGKPYVEANERMDSQIAQTISPKKSERDKQTSGSSSVDLRLHTENMGLRMPTWVVLGCVSNEGKTPTTVVSPGDVNIEERLLQQLQRSQFELLEPESFATKAGRTERAVVTMNIAAWPVADFEAMRCAHLEGKDALSQFEALLMAKADRIVLTTGDVLVLRNAPVDGDVRKHVLHGRPAFNDPSRELLRVFVAR